MNSTRPAYSLVFAFLIMTVMMIVAGTAIQNTTEKLALYNDLGGSSQADLAAQSAAEQGLAAILDVVDTDGDGVNDSPSPGYEASQSEAFCNDTDGDSSCNSWGDFIALAEQRSDGSSFYTPLFGTGTAGNSEDCSVLDYIDPDTGDVLSTITVDVDDPCNWNKLMVGDSVTIPLFDTIDSDDTGTLGEIIIAGDLSGFSGWDLRVRTPCNDETMDSGCGRYELNEDGEISGEGDTVIFWQLVGEDTAGNAVSLIPEDEPGEDELFNTSREAYPENTEIYESLVNDAYLSSEDFIVLSADSSTRYESLLNFCEGDLDGDGIDETDLASLYLQLKIVTPLKDADDGSIPYLEWQLQTSSTDPFADNKTSFVGQGYAQGVANTYYSSYVISRSTTGESTNVYTLSN